MSISKQFVLAGDAIFTIDTPDMGHRTYRVQHVEKNDRWPESWFVKLLTGPDNGSDYSYLGKLDPFTGQVNTTAKSVAKQDSYVVRLLNRVLARIWCDDHAAFEQHGFLIYIQKDWADKLWMDNIASLANSPIPKQCDKNWSGD